LNRKVNGVYYPLNMPVLYITQDQVGIPTGGGLVTGFEMETLASLGEGIVKLDRSVVEVSSDPFENDERFCQAVKRHVAERGIPRMAHFYAGCFTMTVEYLKSKGTKISYTVDAHDPDLSIEEFGRCGIPYEHKHMSDKNLRTLHNKGCVLADLMIVPSSNGEKIMKSVGCRRIAIIPHPVRNFEVSSLPEKFAVGYIGQAGPDKGLRYLFQAWKSEDLKDSRLIVAGSHVEFMVSIWRREGGRNVEIMGYVGGVEQFFRRISVYVQPSVTEGFGIPVLEAMSMGRPVIVSQGAGAVDAITSSAKPIGMDVPIRDPKAIAQAIRFYRDYPDKIEEHGRNGQIQSKGYSTESIRDRYLAAWGSL